MNYDACIVQASTGIALDVQFCLAMLKRGQLLKKLGTVRCNGCLSPSGNRNRILIKIPSIIRSWPTAKYKLRLQAHSYSGIHWSFADVKREKSGIRNVRVAIPRARDIHVHRRDFSRGCSVTSAMTTSDDRLFSRFSSASRLMRNDSRRPEILHLPSASCSSSFFVIFSGRTEIPDRFLRRSASGCLPYPAVFDRYRSNIHHWQKTWICCIRQCCIKYMM